MSSTQEQARCEVKTDAKFATLAGCLSMSPGAASGSLFVIGDAIDVQLRQKLFQ